MTWTISSIARSASRLPWLSIKHRLLGTCTLISLVMFLPAAIAAPQQKSPPPVRLGEPYGRAQQRLLAKGWRPQPRAPHSSCSILQADKRCALFRELVACASTGPGFCRFQWQSPQGQSWALITVGGNPQGDPGAISTWF
jgi:hypothetical protein